MTFNENSRVKFPGLLHFLRIGYTYQSKRNMEIRQYNNILQMYLSSQVVIPLGDILKKFDKLLQPLYQLIKQVEKENQRLSSLREFFLPMMINDQVRYIG